MLFCVCLKIEIRGENYEKPNDKKKFFFRKNRFCTVSSRSVCGIGEYLAVSISGCQIRRRYFPAYLYHSGIDLWIYDDHGGDIVGTYDEKKSGRSICVLWKFTLVFAGRLDQCDHSGFDRAILFGDRWMGFKISG